MPEAEKPNPNLISRIVALLRSNKPDAESISKTLPSPVMPREAVVKQRVRLQKMDEQTRE